MKKGLFGLLALSLLVTAPGCRKEKKEEKQKKLHRRKHMNKKKK